MEPVNQALLEVLQKLRTWEGWTNHLYLDVDGNATIGVGCLVADAHQACALPFWVEDRPAHADEVVAEFERVARMPCGLLADAYKAPATQPRLYLTDDGVTDLGLSRLRALLPGLAHLFPAFYAFPEPAQECLIDLGWNAGLYAPKGLAAWPALLRALNAVPPDFRAASDEVHTKVKTSRGEARNAWRRQQMLSAATHKDV